MNRRSQHAIETILLLILLAVAGLRPLISESHDSLGLEITSALPGFSDPSPTVTLVFDGIVLLVATAWLMIRLVAKDTRYRWCGLEWGLAIIAVASGVSCALAENRRLAINGAVDWVACGLLAILMTQLLRDRLRIRLAICVILASSAAQAVECLHQTFYTFEETEAAYSADREAFWERQGVALDAPQVAMFEARMRAREASGYLAHSNVAGAYLLLCAMTAVALSVARLRKHATGLNRYLVVPVVLLSLLLFGAVGLTHSRGAIIAGGVAGVLWMLRGVFDGVLSRHSKSFLKWGWTTVAIGGAAVIGHGLYHGSLPGRSLDFRWKYWTASTAMVVEHPWTGVGSGNFGRHYLQYKTIESPEEIKNPHNFLVSAATDWGIGGLVGMMLMVFGASRVVTSGDTLERKPPESSEPGQRTRVYVWGVALAVGIFLPRIWLLGNADPNYVFFATGLPLIVWIATYLLLVLGDEGRLSSLACGMAFAMFAFLLQDTINFASLVPGTATTAFALLGILIAIRYENAGPDATRILRRPRVWATAACVAIALYLVVALIPAGRTNAALRTARQAVDFPSAYDAFVEAAEYDLWDPTPLFQAAIVARRASTIGGGERAWAQKAVHAIDRCIDRDRNNVAVYRERARCYRRLAELTPGVDAAGYHKMAVESAAQAVGLYPTDPNGYLAWGACLADYGRFASDADSLHRAVDAYRDALRLDDARPNWETIRRMSPRERTAVASKIAALESSRSD